MHMHGTSAPCCQLDVHDTHAVLMHQDLHRVRTVEFAGCVFFVPPTGSSP